MRWFPTTRLALAAAAAVVVVVVSPRRCRAFSPPHARPRRLAAAAITRLRQSKAGGGGGGGDNNNVVFRPSPDPAAFDSYRIGSARVHRYSEPGSDAAYVMWYHGRDASLDSQSSSPSSAASTTNEKTKKNDDDDDDDTREGGRGGEGMPRRRPPPLPPLSTGRIGRATSRNGLAWRRDDDGSVDSDAPGSCLGLNVESWYGFDTSHVGLGQVLLPMTSPSIRSSEGGVYVMYYMGGNYEVSDLATYLPRRRRREDDDDDSDDLGKLVPNDAKLRGMKLRIGAAISQDGITWGRVEGDDPSGACMVPYDLGDVNNDDVVIARDPKTGRLHEVEEELYCGWPEVIVNPVGPNEDARRGSGASADTERINFYMYYSTMLKESGEKALACAVSNNGFAWSKAGTVRFVDDDDDDDGPTALDGGGRARCNVVRRATLDDDGTWVEGRSWMMFYEGVSIEDGRHRILAAESDDLREWRRLGLALDVGRKAGGEDDIDGDDDDDNDDDDDVDAWDSRGVGSPHVIRLDDGYFRMYYTGEGSDGRTAIGVARSVDMKVWERERVVELSSLLNR
ncbi:hypothetical protein ACHAW5_004655 [Stephanodiscus triporus]|uniref:Arabinan endo-1,5-alpha-L-arabinosidase n=1 Tax=Stephanodiscus triporus TaxID=2934178 RepID=A0ABD3MHS9_9STRA